MRASSAWLCGDPSAGEVRSTSASSREYALLTRRLNEETDWLSSCSRETSERASKATRLSGEKSCVKALTHSRQSTGARRSLPAPSGFCSASSFSDLHSSVPVSSCCILSAAASRTSNGRYATAHLSTSSLSVASAEYMCTHDRNCCMIPGMSSDGAPVSRKDDGRSDCSMTKDGVCFTWPIGLSGVVVNLPTCAAAVLRTLLSEPGKATEAAVVVPPDDLLRGWAVRILSVLPLGRRMGVGVRSPVRSAPEPTDSSFWREGARDIPSLDRSSFSSVCFEDEDEPEANSARANRVNHAGGVVLVL